MKFEVVENKFSNNTKCIFDLKKLPLTERFGKFNVNHETYDQELHICLDTGHVFLKNILSPETLYSKKEYKYNTSNSPLSSRTLSFFLDFCANFVDISKSGKIIDIGGNDLSLMKLWKKINPNSQCYVIDPVCEDIDGEVIDGINIVGKFFENIDLREISPNVVVCRHTLEHIIDPLRVLKDLIEKTEQNTIFVFEVPSYESMIEGHRFDTIFHQHLNYFSVDTFSNMVIQCGGKVLDYEINHQGSCGGSLMIAFKKSSDYLKPIKVINIENKINEFKNALKNYQLEMKILNDTFSNLKGLKYGYGAGLMLSTFAYHSKIDFSMLECILDDDEAKDGLTYENIPVKVRSSSSLRPEKNSSFIITSLENIRPIYNRIVELSPRRIFIPSVS